jgi:TfoX/Sxy family transcriptional regulator of competence genes
MLFQSLGIYLRPEVFQIILTDQFRIRIQNPAQDKQKQSQGKEGREKVKAKKKIGGKN